MLINIPVKFNDPRTNPFSAMCDTSWKLQIFTKSRAINLTKQKKCTWKYTGAQLHMLSNIPVKFHDSRSNTFSAMCDTKWERTDRQTLKGHFYCYFLLFNRGPWSLILLLQNEFYCSLLFCLQLEGPLSLFGSADGQTDKGKCKCPPNQKVEI
jgi:hypothetical protein